MRLISLTRLWRRRWRARCSAQLVPVAPSSPVPVAVVPEPVEEPGECATFRYASPGAARAALTSLLGRRDAARRNEALYVLRGAKMAVQRELRDLAQRTEDELMELKSEKQVTVALRRFLLDAASIELQIEDAVEQLVTLTPLPLEALLAAFATQHGRVMLGRLKPMDVLWVPEDRPDGFPRSAHSFLRLMQWKQGPFYRDKDYIRVHKDEREHFPWVMEQVRIKGQEFFYQYWTAELKTGRDRWSLVLEADAFVTLISEKLFALATLLHMPAILERQEALDATGSIRHRWLFLQDFSSIPPPLSAVKLAFGIDAAERRDVTADQIFKDWQRCNLWRRRRTYKIKETVFPGVSQLGDLALACHLRHRPFVAALAELTPESAESPLRRWYLRGGTWRPEEPVLNVLFSQEMLKGLSKYCAEALQAAEYASKQNYGDTGTKAVSPYRVLCIGSGCSRLRHYLHFLLSKILPGKDVKVAAVLPRGDTEARDPARPCSAMARWPSLDEFNEETPFHPPETQLSLEEALEVYAPRLVICVCMPPGIDWSSAFRRCPSVLEYLLLGPADTERCGHLAETWGGPLGFANRGKDAKMPGYAAAGFVRHDLEELSETVLGTDDAPGRVGTNSIVSFRRLLKPSLTRAAAEGVSQIWALPLRLENGGGEGEVWFALERRKTGQPWTGDAVAAAARLSVPDEPKHEKSAGILSTSGMFCWLVVLCLLAYYLHVVQPVWFVHFMRKSQTMLAMVHGVHGSEREHHFGQFEAAAEMTNPWSWPTTIPSRAAPRVPRSTRMYGTLDL